MVGQEICFGCKAVSEKSKRDFVLGTDFSWRGKLLLYLRAPTMPAKYLRYDEK